MLKPGDDMTFISGWIAGYRAAGGDLAQDADAVMDQAFADYEKARRAVTVAEEDVPPEP